MASLSRSSSYALAPGPVEQELDPDLAWPWGRIDGIGRDDIRETAYEIFFTACRSAPGFGGRNALAFYSAHTNNDGGGGGNDGGASGAGRGNGVGMSPVSRIKRALGLKTLKRMQSRRTLSLGGGSPLSSPTAHGSQSSRMAFTIPAARTRRPMTSAEIMRQQMMVTEQSDNRLRKTLMRTLVGQMGRRAETIILPLELLRHLKPSEFADSREYHLWQKRQLKMLESGLLLHPSVPLDCSNAFAIRLREIVRAAESRPIDTSKNSETMRSLCNCVVSLSWRSPVGSAPPDVCHWADGHPLNIHFYIALLRSVFDLRDESLVLDEVDELLELIKKTWSSLGITRPIHNICFAFVLFQQYIVTSQSEPDLLSASLAMMVEVSADAKKADREPGYIKVLSVVLTSIRRWVEKRLLDYHDSFHKGTVGLMETLIPLSLSAAKILEEDLGGIIVASEEKVKMVDAGLELPGNWVDYYIRSSLKHAFIKLLEVGSTNSLAVKLEADVSHTLFRLAKETEEMAAKEKEIFSPVLKKWHPIAAGVAAVSLHTCYGAVLKQYLVGVSGLTNEVLSVLQRAAQLEKVLVQMVVEDSVDCEDGGKTIVREMVPYEVDYAILDLLRKWIQESLKGGKDCIERAKEYETWNPKSKMEPHAQSVVELIRVVEQTVDDFLDIPVGISEDVVQELAEGVDALFRDYINFVASCGSKQNYAPQLPPLTRCNRDSKFTKLWRKASSCSISGMEELQCGHHIFHDLGQHHHPRPSTSRGTQRLYVRLNTVHYLLSHLNSLEKTLSLSPRVIPSSRTRFASGLRNLAAAASYFDISRSSAQAACQHISEVAAHRLIFHDSNSILYDGLYVDDVAKARIRPALRLLKQNLALLCSILTDRAQPLAIKEVMKAAFEAYLMVLLAGGHSRVFYRFEHDMIEEDFNSLKRVFCSCGEGLIAEDVVSSEAETVQGVVALMGQPTEQLIEDFSAAACEASGMGVVAAGKQNKLPMPPTTGLWNRSDPNTILRVLCSRNDRGADQFLKRTFQLAKRK